MVPAPDYELLNQLRQIPGMRSVEWESSAVERKHDAQLTWLRETLRRKAPRLRQMDRNKIANFLIETEQSRGLDPLLVLAIMEQESRFNRRAVGPRGSLGLMQIRPFVGRAVAKRYRIPWRGPETLYDPVHNVKIGVHYYLELREMFPSTELRLTAYNMGPNGLKRMLRRGQEPRWRYSTRVFSHYGALLDSLVSVAGL